MNRKRAERTSHKVDTYCSLFIKDGRENPQSKVTEAQEIHTGRHDPTFDCFSMIKSMPSSSSSSVRRVSTSKTRGPEFKTCAKHRTVDWVSVSSSQPYFKGLGADHVAQ